MTDSAESDQNTDETFLLADEAGWMDTVRLFEAGASSWLTPADAPQLQALRSIAKQLDSGKFQAALISQFTLVHRALRDKDPARAKSKPAGSDETPREPDLLDMLNSNPGVFWRPGQ